MATQFGGGKTHALTLLFHLARNGEKSNKWQGVGKIMESAGIKNVPEAATAVFVGTEFDVITGRGGEDGTPKRMTPWGEIAFQLGGVEAFNVIAEHDAKGIAPGGDAIRQFLPDKPCLILIDELMNYISRNRRLTPVDQLYNFLQNLSEEIRGRSNSVMAVSIPASELEMTVQDQADHERLKKLLDRLGKAVVMSAEGETSEIIRRRLFEWDDSNFDAEGKIILPREAVQACNEYAEWVERYKQQLPAWFSPTNAREAFMTAYPFHPLLLSVFERKWQTLPRFQRTRGVLRMLALWVADSYEKGYKTMHKDSLIGLGSAPLENPNFRAAVFEQLGEPRLEVAVTTDICGKPDSHAVVLDSNAEGEIKQNNLHRKVAASIFFESNGGAIRIDATEPEIRLAVSEPALNIGHVETVLDALGSSCYYLNQERKNYRFGMTANLNKILSDRRAAISSSVIDERVETEIRETFRKGNRVERVYFPTKSNQIPDTPSLTVVVLPPGQPTSDPSTITFIERLTKEYGQTNRVFKSSLLWSVSEGSAGLREEARKLAEWDNIQTEQEALRLDEGQKVQLRQNLEKARKDFSEMVWTTYKNVVFLDKDNQLRTVDLGLIHSSSAEYIVQLIVNRLRKEGVISEAIGTDFLVRNWSGAFDEWSVKAVRDAFFASPKLPRLLNGNVIVETIVRGVSSGHFAYVGKKGDGSYEPFYYNHPVAAADIEISDDVFIIKREKAEEYVKQNTAKEQVQKGTEGGNEGWDEGSGTTETDDFFNTGNSTQGNGQQTTIFDEPEVEADSETCKGISWSGAIPTQKWMVFYTKVLTKLAKTDGLKITINVEANPSEGLSKHTVEEIRTELREMGLDENLETH